jgi:hypothetical protein
LKNLEFGFSISRNKFVKIVLLVKSYKKNDYNAKITLDTKNIECIYDDIFDISKVSENDIKKIKKHNFKKSFSS